MDTINDRIAWAVKDSGLTRTAFAEKINVTQQFVSNLCLGKTNPSDRTIADICREFGISEEWLRTGSGEPHIARDKDENFIRICEEINLSDDDLIKRIIRAYWMLEEEEKAVVRKLIDSFSQK